MRVIDQNYTLENGVEIPKIGLGTWQVKNGAPAYDAVTFALKHGYRHIDTARAYRNEESVGKAVRDSGIDRSKIFVTSKCPAEVKDYHLAHKNFETTMSELGLDYLDLYLIHAPWPWDNIGEDCTEGNIAVWKALEEIYKSGRCRAIGVSNFSVSDITAILENSKIKPMANQISYFIGHTQNEITTFCQKRNILIEAYSPLATGRILHNKQIAEMAEKYNKTIAQLSIRYTLQKGTLPLPKSVHPEYILQNADVDFEICPEDMAYLDSLKETV